MFTGTKLTSDNFELHLLNNCVWVITVCLLRETKTEKDREMYIQASRSRMYD